MAPKHKTSKKRLSFPEDYSAAAPKIIPDESHRPTPTTISAPSGRAHIPMFVRSFFANPQAAVGEMESQDGFELYDLCN